MCRHLVVFGVVFQRLKDGRIEGDEQLACYSGFPLLVGDNWCYVTAGHIIQDELIPAVEEGHARINKYLLADYFGPEPKCNEPTPFEYEDAGKAHLDDRRLGLDFALIHLRELYAKSLAANGIEPISRANWSNAPALTFESYAMLGVPTELSEPVVRQGERGEQGGLAITLSLVTIERLECAPETVEMPPGDWFIGRVRVPFSIRGMSGGPIFGFRRNEAGRWTYHVLAVQSRWFEKQGVILGCPIPAFMSLVEEELERYAREQATAQATAGEAITKTPGVCGGEACLRGTRHTVWGLVERKRGGATDAALREMFRPPLTQDDLDAAWAYAAAHPDEIERALWLNDAVMIEHDGAGVPADFVRRGRGLGLTDEEIRDAFEPPLTQQALDRIFGARG
jgi:uncharacterized protein (DUF433 family)